MEDTTMTFHFNPDISKKVALIFGAPGRNEDQSEDPVTGGTKSALNALLKMLSKGRIVKRYKDRYDVRIINAVCSTRYNAKTGHAKITKKDIREENNINRLFDELKDIQNFIICFGDHAQLAIEEVLRAGFQLKENVTIIKVRHLNPRAFTCILKNNTAAARANYVYEQIKDFLDKQKYNLKLT
jgi:uracil-DNA glycosylase